MNIGEAAQASGLSAKAIRYYEDLGLVVPARDQNNDYRVYASNDVERLRFLQRARAVGFSLGECSELLALYVDSGQRCEAVRSLVLEKIAQVDQQLSTLTSLRETLAQMASECNGGTSELTGMGAAPTGRSVGMAFTLLGESEVR